jgi:hypothetical protein
MTKRWNSSVASPMQRRRGVKMKRFLQPEVLRACLKIPWASCFRGKGWMARRDERGYPQRSPTEEKRSQPVFSSKALRATGLLPVAGVGSVVTARCGDAHGKSAGPSPPWPQTKSLAAGPHAIFRQALRRTATGPRSQRAGRPRASQDVSRFVCVVPAQTAIRGRRPVVRHSSLIFRIDSYPIPKSEPPKTERRAKSEDRRRIDGLRESVSRREERNAAPFGGRASDFFRISEFELRI